MTNLRDRIQALGDNDAQRILTTFASHQPGYSDRRFTGELVQALHNEPTLEAAEVATSGELARAALLLLADEPNHTEVPGALVSGPPPERYGLLETTVVVSAALFVLGTHVKVERDKAGQWAFKIEKKPTDNALLKALLGKLLSFAGQSGEIDKPY